MEKENSSGEAKNSHGSKKGSHESKKGGSSASRQGSQGDMQENNDEIYKEINVFHVSVQKVQDDSSAMEHSQQNESSSHQKTATFNNHTHLDSESQDQKMSD